MYNSKYNRLVASHVIEQNDINITACIGNTAKMASTTRSRREKHDDDGGDIDAPMSRPGSSSVGQRSDSGDIDTSSESEFLRSLVYVLDCDVVVCICVL